jgi:agmatine deiminase
LQPLDDLWIRDTGAVFVRDSRNGLFGVNFNFNGWGQENTGAAGWARDTNKSANGIVRQPIELDRQVADFLIKQAGAVKLSTWLVMEGGGIEVNGKGTAICTESCILNANRNPGRTKAEVESELLRLLGVKKVIWLPGVKAQEITDGHVDFYARFVGESTVVYGLETDPQSPDYATTQTNQKILLASTDAQGNKLKAVPLKAPDFVRVQAAVEARNGWSSGRSFFNATGFAAGYVGFYLANSCVLMSSFGDPSSDQAAFDTLRNLYPGRVVMQMTTDGIANGGGTIHCATQQQI